MAIGRYALAVATIAIALAGVLWGGASVPVDLVEAHGLISGSSSLCLTPEIPSGPAAAHATLEPLATGGAFSTWRVTVQGNAPFGCPVAAAAHCLGVGTLGLGVSIERCMPEGSGTFGPVTVCTPGPSKEPDSYVRGSAGFTFKAALGSFSGTLEVWLFGATADQAPNPCV